MTQTADSDNKYRGYVSENSKRTFTITVGILGVLGFFAQFLMPVIMMFAMMPGMFKSDFFRMIDVDQGALWNGKIWFIERSLGPMNNGAGNIELKSWVLDSPGEPTTVQSLSLDNPWLLPGENDFFIVTSDAVGKFNGREFEIIGTEKKLGSISRPFFYQGSPAVIEFRPDGIALQAFVNGDWKESGFLRTSAIQPGFMEDIQVISDGAFCGYFTRYKGTVYFHRGLPTDKETQAKEWEPVVSGAYWCAVVIDGSPAVIAEKSINASPELVGYKKQEKGWTLFLTMARKMPAGFGVYPAPAGESFYLAMQAMPGTLSVMKVVGNEIKEKYKFGSGFPFPGFFIKMMVLQYAGFLVIPLVLAIIFSAMMRKHRVAEYTFEQKSVAQASLIRRAIAQIVDFAVAAAPAALGFSFIMRNIFDFEEMDPTNVFGFFGLFAAGTVWGLFCFVVFAILEGKYGKTPGKWLVGIRVVGTDLLLCGFGRAFVRNLLKIVDGFLNFMVGILIVSLSENWQRVGDMAARTIVVRDPKRKG